MTRPNKATLAAILLGLMLSSCNQATQELLNREGETLRQNMIEKQQLYRPVVGQYEGTLTYDKSGERVDVTLNIISTLMTVQNPGRNDVSQLPTLGGGLSLRIASADPSEEPDFLAIATYHNGEFDPNSGELILSGSIISSTLGTVLVHLKGTHSEDHITAIIQTSSRRIGTIDVVRTDGDKL